MFYVFLAVLFLMVSSLLVLLAEKRIAAKDLDGLSLAARIAWKLLALVVMLVALGLGLGAVVFLHSAMVDTFGPLRGTVVLVLVFMFNFVLKILRRRLVKQ